MGAFTQPEAGLQLSSVHAFESSQGTADPPPHDPPLHVSPVVQALPSSHGLLFGVYTQPEAGLQLSSVHPLPSLQTTDDPPLHDPPLHASPVVHALPSSHEAVLFVCSQPVAGLQLSSVHGLPSSQLEGAPPVHTPA
jgi:hypothetical protein